MNDTNTTNQQRTKKLIIEREEKELRLIIIGKSGNGERIKKYDFQYDDR